MDNLRMAVSPPRPAKDLLREARARGEFVSVADFAEADARYRAWVKGKEARERRERDVRELAELDGWAFPVPPVPTGGWTRQDWCRYIRMHGHKASPQLRTTLEGEAT